MTRRLLRPPVLLMLLGLVAVAVVALVVLATRHDGARVVADPSASGWQTIEHEGVRVTIPASWQRFERDDCEFRSERWGPPDETTCLMSTGVAFYASATFDPATGPGVHRTERKGEPTWGGYAYAGELAVYAAADDRGVVSRVVSSAEQR